MATHRVAQSVRGSFRKRGPRLAPPNAKVNPLDRLYAHTCGPYKASFRREEGLWHVFWDGWVDEPTVRCDTEQEAAAEVQRLGLLWQETAGRKVYFIGPACRIGERVKIGVAYEPKKRLSNLQTASHEPLLLLAVMPGDEAEEARLHRKFSRSRLSGEWFRITPTLKRMIEANQA